MNTFYNNRSQKGSAGLVLLLCLGLSLALIKYGDLIFAKMGVTTGEQSSALTGICLAVLVSVAAIYSLMRSLNPGKANSKRGSSGRIKNLKKFVALANEELNSLEDYKKTLTGAIPRSIVDRINVLKRIITSMSRTIDDAEELLKQGGKLNRLYVDELLSEPLMQREDSMTDLIQLDPIPPIPADKWEDVITNHLQLLRLELDEARKCEPSVGDILEGIH